jgi:hypothetical protein
MEQPNSLVKIALAEVVQKVNSGSNPTVALKKVATDLDLNPNYIHRVGEALNVALHYNHFKTASDRSSQFDIADIPTVVSSIFEGTEKTSSQYVADNFGKNEANDEVFNYNRAISNPKYKQAYLEISGATATEESYGLSMQGAFHKSANLIKDLEQALDNSLTDKVGAELAVNSKFSKLAQHFRRDEGYRTSFEEFESQVYSKHGEAAVPYLDLIYKTAGISDERGVHDDKYVMFTPSSELGMYDSLMKAAADLLVAEETVKTAESDCAFEKEYYAEIGKLVAGNGSLSKSSEEEPVINSKKKNKPVEVREEVDPILERISKKAALRKEGNVANLFALSNILGGSKIRESVMENVSDRFSLNRGPVSSAPRNNMTLENMERQLIFQELVMTDPILSRANPQKVAKAYEQILRLSPQVSKEKEVVRAMLRQAVASQAIAPHDADQWTKLDMDILKRKIVSDNYLRGKLDGTKF